MQNATQKPDFISLGFIRRDHESAEQQTNARLERAKQQLSHMKKLPKSGGKAGVFLTLLIEEEFENHSYYQDLSLKTMAGTVERVDTTVQHGYHYFMDSPANRAISAARLENRQNVSLKYIKQLDDLHRAETGHSLLEKRYPHMMEEIAYAAGRPPANVPVLKTVLEESPKSHVVPAIPVLKIDLPRDTVGGMPGNYWKHRNDTFVNQIRQAKGAQDLVTLYKNLTKETSNARDHGTVGYFQLKPGTNARDRHDLVARLNLYKEVVEEHLQSMGFKDATEAIRAQSKRDEWVKHSLKSPSQSVEQTGRDSMWGRLKEKLVNHRVLSGVFNHQGEKLNDLRQGLSRIFGRVAAGDMDDQNRKSVQSKRSLDLALNLIEYWDSPQQRSRSLWSTVIVQ